MKLLNANILFFKTRSDLEKFIITSSDVYGVVLRPSAVYGDHWGMWRWLWYPSDKLILTGHKDKIFGWNHIADVSDAILRAVEAPTALVSGEIFDIAEDTRVRFYDMRRAVWKAAGYKWTEEEAPLDEKNFIDVASNVRLIQSGAKLRRVLGWKPRHLVLDSLDFSYKALKAQGLTTPPAKAE